MAEIISLAPKKTDPKIVAALENLLKEAKAGNLIEFEMIARYEAGQVLYVGEGDRNDVFLMFGALTNAALNYRDMHIEGYDDL